MGCLLCASPRLSAFGPDTVRNPLQPEAGQTILVPVLPLRTLGHTHWDMAYPDLEPRAFILATNIFGSAHKRETRKG